MTSAEVAAFALLDPPLLELASAIAAPPIASASEWLLGLPWVVEHPLPEMDSTVHVYAIECADLSSPHIFAITGLTAGARSHVSVSVVVPRRMARGWQQARWGEPIIHLPANQLLVSLRLSLDDVDLERLTLVAYRHAFHSSEL